MCTNKPNKLVLTVFQFLSNEYAVAALAGRAIVDIEIVSVMQFALKGLAGRWEQRRLYELAIVAMNNLMPRGGLIDAIRNMGPSHIPNWKAKVDEWKESQSEMWGLIYAAALEP